jgi:hypothetical protein
MVVVLWLLSLTTLIVADCLIRDIRPPKCDPENKVGELVNSILVSTFAHAALGRSRP